MATHSHHFFAWAYTHSPWKSAESAESRHVSGSNFFTTTSILAREHSNERTRHEGLYEYASLFSLCPSHRLGLTFPFLSMLGSAADKAVRFLWLKFFRICFLDKPVKSQKGKAVLTMLKTSGKGNELVVDSRDKDRLLLFLATPSLRRMTPG